MTRIGVSCSLYIMSVYVFFNNLIKCEGKDVGLHHDEIAPPRDADGGDCRLLLEVPANVLNNDYRTADKGDCTVWFWIRD
jgi:hypothetical protein